MGLGGDSGFVDPDDRTEGGGGSPDGGAPVSGTDGGADGGGGDPSTSAGGSGGSGGSGGDGGAPLFWARGGGGGGGGGPLGAGAGGGGGGGGGGGDGASPGDGDGSETGERAAAQRASALERRVVELEAELRSAREALMKAELRTEMDAALIGARSLDLETGRLVLEHELGQMDEPDVEAALARVQASKPFLFAGDGGARGGSGSTAMAAGVDAAGAGADLERLAAGIRETGDRRELMRYLRLRRGA